MALIRNAEPKNVSGAYERLFNNREMGTLVSKLQSTVISSGNELQNLITDRVPAIPDLDAFLEQEIMPEGVYLVRKQQMKQSKKLDFSGAEPDFMIFKRRDNQQRCHIVELKDGHIFDTKKASAERQAMHGFAKRNALHLPYVVSVHFCAFNQEDKEAILVGFKHKIAPEEVMTGREFCEMLEINYDDIVAGRLTEGSDNLDYFCRELVKIPAVQERLERLTVSRMLALHDDSDRAGARTEQAVRHHDLDDLAGTWVDDPAFDQAIEAMDQVDPALWR